MKRWSRILVLGAAVGLAVGACASSTGRPASLSDVAAAGTSCEPLNEGARIDEVTLKYVTPLTGGPFGWSGIVASGSITSESCDPLVLAPSDFALSSPTNVIKCGDPTVSPLEAKAFGGPAFPLTLEPGAVSPVIVAFEGTFVEESGLEFYADLGLHCASPGAS